jgi:hypothetical protein
MDYNTYLRQRLTVLKDAYKAVRGLEYELAVTKGSERHLKRVKVELDDVQRRLNSFK